MFIGTNFNSKLNDNVSISFTDELGFGTFGQCIGDPNAVAAEGNFTNSAIIRRVDTLSGSNLFINQGTILSPSWTILGGGAGNPAGSSEMVQYNFGGVFGADGDFRRKTDGSGFGVSSTFMSGATVMFLQGDDLFGIGLAGGINAYSDNGFTTSFTGIVYGDFTGTGGQPNAVLVGVQPFGPGSGQSTSNYGYDSGTDSADMSMSVKSNFGTQAQIGISADPTGSEIQFNFGGGSDNYTFPNTQPTAGTAMGYTSSHTLGWVAIGGGGIAIGDPVTGASADSVLFIDGAGQLAQEIAGLVYQPGGNFFVGNGLGSAFLLVNPSGNTYAIGDINNTHNKTRLYIDDAARTVKVRTDVTFGVHDSSGNTFFNVDLQSVSRGVQLGDIAAAFHKTLFSVDDFNSRITATIPLFFNIQNALGQRVMTADVSSGAGGFVWKAGDVDNVIGANGTQISVDDGNTIAQMGNISGNMGGTVLQVQDSMLQIHAITSGHFRVVNLSGQAWLDINTAGSGQIGDISGGGNGTFIAVNDFNRTITVSNVPTFANDAAAIGGGLITGQLYKTTTAGTTSVNIVP